MATQQIPVNNNNGANQNPPIAQQQVGQGGLQGPQLGVAGVVQPVNQAAVNGLNNGNQSHSCGFFCEGEDAKHVDRIFTAFGVPRKH